MKQGACYIPCGKLFLDEVSEVLGSGIISPCCRSLTCMGLKQRKLC